VDEVIWNEEVQIQRSKTGEEEVPDSKTSLENSDLTKKNHELEERRTGEEQATQA